MSGCSLVGFTVATAAAGLAVRVDAEEDSGAALGAEFLLADEFAVLNAVLGPLGGSAGV